MKKIIILIFALGFTLTACEKEDDNPEQQTGEFIKSIAINGEPVITFTYNGLNQLITKKTTVDGAVMEETYTYEDGLMATETMKVNGDVIAQYSFEYDNDKRLQKCNVEGTVDVNWTFTYDGDKITEAYYNINGGVAKKQLYTYNGDNIIKVEEYYSYGETWTLITVFEFEYDNKNNPMKPLKIPFSEDISEFVGLFSSHNITYMREYDPGIEEEVYYTYTYNDKQYPITCNDGTDNYTFTYLP